MWTVILFIIILSLLVFVHEFGHFITARKSGMKVYEFGFGFPPRAFGAYKDPKTKKWVFVKGKGKNSISETVGGEDRAHPDEFPATLYSINWLPLGGFVKIKGENGEAAGEPDSFGAHPFWQKAAVLLAGVTMNVLLAGVLFGIGFVVGLPADAETLGDPQAIVVEEPAVLVQDVVDGSPADAAGFRFGDKVLAVNGEPIADAKSLVALIVQNGTEEIDVLLARGSETVSATLTPSVLLDDDSPKVGVILVDAGVVRYPWYIAFYKGFVAAGISLINIFIAFYLLIKGLVLGQGLVFSVAGPVGIAVMVGDSARLGISYLIHVTAMLSLSLAVVNVLPIPALDGGRLLFVTIEKIFKRPVPLKYEQLAHTVGFVLLMVLVVVVTWRDVVGLF